MNILFKTKNYVRKKVKTFFLTCIYLSRISFKDSTQKQIVFCCDGYVNHGGLVDRLKGIISFYYISELTNCDFKIHFVSPVKLDNYFIPNNKSWVPNKKDLLWNPFQCKILYLIDDHEFNPIAITNNSAQKYFVYSNVDYLSKIVNTSNYNINILWGVLFNKLFKPSKILYDTIDEYKLPDNRIAFHARFTSILGDFKDVVDKRLDSKRANSLMKSCKDLIDYKVGDLDVKNIFIYSDSCIFLDYIKKNTQYTVLDGKVLHLDLNKADDSIGNHLKTFVDFISMAESEKIYLVRIQEMYNSQFSLYSSRVYNRYFEIISN
jgi:hypothetical protein